MSGDSTDSAGLPWAGRSLPDPGFAGDDGTAAPGLVDALAAASGRPSAQHDRALLALLAEARLIVPIVAAPTETEVTERGLAVEKSTDMAVVTLVRPDGRRALPVFTSTGALTTYDASARPVPVSAATAARAGISESCDVLVVDLGSDHVTELRPSMVWALAQEAEWRPAHEDPFVARAVQASVADEPLVGSVGLEEGDPSGAGVLRVVLGLAPGLDGSSVEALATRVGERLATDGELRARVDALTFALRRAEPTS